MKRNEMLDAINMKIARTQQSDEWTGYFLPVMIGDVLDWVESLMKWEWTKWEPNAEYPFVYERILEYWKTKREPLDKQSDDCIQYVYNLIK